jgi:hypothetical protein
VLQVIAMSRDVARRCPRCGSFDLTTIIVPVDGSLLSVEYCPECSHPNWEAAKEQSLDDIIDRSPESADR